VVDPERNVDGYLTYLAKNGLELRYTVDYSDWSSRFPSLPGEPATSSHLGCAVSPRMESGASGRRASYSIAAVAPPHRGIFQKGAFDSRMWEWIPQFDSG